EKSVGGRHDPYQHPLMVCSERVMAKGLTATLALGGAIPMRMAVPPFPTRPSAASIVSGRPRASKAKSTPFGRISRRWDEVSPLLGSIAWVAPSFLAS